MGIYLPRRDARGSFCRRREEHGDYGDCEYLQQSSVRLRFPRGYGNTGFPGGHECVREAFRDSRVLERGVDWYV